MALLLVASAGLLWGDKLPKKDQPLGEPTVNQAPEVETEYVAQDKLPEKLPADLPTEEGAPIQRNEVVKISANETQYARNYLSKKTVAENYAIYEKYFNDTGWRITSTSTAETYASLSAQKADTKEVLLVNISKNSITGDVSVEVNMVVR